MANILVVDDEIGIRELLSEILADEGHTVRVAENATAARDARGRERPDLVLLDIWMPDTDGISLLKEWAAGGQLTMPVVMMSGHATIDTAVEATRIGALDFLEKPIAMQKLLATVKRALRTGEASPATGLALGNLGRSAVIADLRKRLGQLAPVAAPLLLRGEPGVMPELFARAAPASGHAVGDRGRDARRGAAGAPRAGRRRDPVRRRAGGARRASSRRTSRSSPRAPSVSKVRLVTFTAEDPRRLTDERGFDPSSSPSSPSSCCRCPRSASTPKTSRRSPRCCSRSSSKRASVRRGSSRPPRSTRCATSPGRATSRSCSRWCGPPRSPRSTTRSAPTTSAGRCPPSTARRPSPALPLDLPLREAREAFERAYFEHHLARESSISRLAEKSGLERTHLYRKLKQLGLGPTKKEE